MANFEAALQRVLRWEGGLVDDPNDPGGLTKFGISQRSYPQLDIRTLTLDQAGHIYRRDYWDGVGGTFFVDQRLAAAVFDAAVNHGVMRASKMLQLIVGTEPDGIVGPITLRAVNSSNADDVRLRFLLKRIDFMTDIVQRNWTQRRFLVGWINRVMSYV
jgi:lysozyme family protein